MLTSHPKIAIPPECGFAVWHAKKYEDWRVGDPRLDEFLADLKSSRKIETWNLDYPRLKEKLLQGNPRSYSEVVSTVYEFFASEFQPGANRWGDKNNFYLNHVGDLDRLFPKALFIHIVRDGRDVCCSYRDLQHADTKSPYAPKLPVKPEDVAREWTQNLSAIGDGLSKLDSRRVHELRYEDLLNAPESELGRVCEFIGEPYSDTMLDYAERNRRDGLEPTDFLAWKRLTLEPPDTQRAGRFRRELDPESIARFNAIAAETLARFRYTL